MKQSYLVIRIFLMVVGIFLLGKTINALTGSQIIKNADNYRTFTWTCNTRNARPANRIIAWNYNDSTGNGGRDIRYPFYPKGVEIGPDPDGPEGPLPAPTATGEYTGVAYASDEISGTGNDTLENYDKKLESKDPAYLVGFYKIEGIEQPPYQYYAGIDCSGLVQRCWSFPPVSFNKNVQYGLLRITTNHLLLPENLFSDPIDWNEIKKGDLLIRREYISEDGNTKSGHVGIATSSPNGNEVNAIDASDNTGFHDVINHPPIVGTCTYTLVKIPYNIKDTNPIQRSDGGKRYKPRRISPPYVKSVRIYNPVYSDDKKTLNNLNKIYEKGWIEVIDENTNEIIARKVVLIKDNPGDCNKLIMEIKFSKAMALRSADDWENISVFVKTAQGELIKVHPLKSTDFYEDKLNNKNKEKFNNIYNGWADAVAVYEENKYFRFYSKWIGYIEEEDLKGYSGELTLEISAKSLMQDGLDSDPTTIAKRTPEGGWKDYEV